MVIEQQIASTIVSGIKELYGTEIDGAQIQLGKTKKEFKYEKFKKVCIEYSLASFLTNEFIKPFKALHHE